jgi:hypothetical protein
MDTQKLIAAAGNLASVKPAFLLSELSTALPHGIPLPELYRILLPHFGTLGLTATKTGGDYQIRVRTKLDHYVLSDPEKKRIDSFISARRVPPALEDAVEQYITKKVQKPWDDPVILERLRRAIVAQKAEYWKEVPRKRSLSYSKGYTVLGYLAYHFPVYFMQTQYLMRTITSAGMLRPSMTILDVGTGPGVVPLAVAGFYSHLDNARATIHTIEKSEEHIEAFLYLTNSFQKSPPNVIIKPPVRADIRNLSAVALPDQVDLLVFSNVLNELDDCTMEERADIVMQLAERLSQDGSILIAEPAEEITATRLRSLSQALRERGLSVHSPCPDLWGTRCDASRCWSFETRPRIHPTKVMEALADCKEPFRYINTDIKYAYVILKKDKKVQHPFRVPPRSKFARFSKLHLHLNRRINVIAAKMSQDLGDRKTHVFKLCDGTAAKPVYGVVPAYHRSPSNEVLVKAPYGEIIELRNVLVRYNRAHDAYNLLVSRNTCVSNYSN